MRKQRRRSVARYRATDQRLCFRSIDNTIPLISKPLVIFCGCTAPFVSELVGNPEDRVSHEAAHFKQLRANFLTAKSDLIIRLVPMLILLVFDD